MPTSPYRIECSMQRGPRRFGMPGTGSTSLLAEVLGDDDAATGAVELDRFQRTKRTDDLSVRGDLGEGSVQRRRFTRFAFIDAAGTTRARFRAMTGRPTRGFRQSWDLELPDGRELSIVDRGTMLTHKDIVKEVRGQELTRYDERDGAPGVVLRVWAGRALLEVDTSTPSGGVLGDPLLAATFGLVVWKMHQRPSA